MARPPQAYYYVRFTKEEFDALIAESVISSKNVVKQSTCKVCGDSGFSCRVCGQVPKGIQPEPYGPTKPVTSDNLPKHPKPTKDDQCCFAPGGSPCSVGCTCSCHTAIAVPSPYKEKIEKVITSAVKEVLENIKTGGTRWYSTEKYTEDIEHLCQEAYDRGAIEELERLKREIEPLWEQASEGLQLWSENVYNGRSYKCCPVCGFSPLAQNDYFNARLKELNQRTDQ